MALSDGAHTMTEEFSYFTLLNQGESIGGDHDVAGGGTTETHQSSDSSHPTNPHSTSLFGISCTRQIRADKLKRRSADVTRSTVQKAVVVVSPTARRMGELRERLGAVTAAWFAQE